MAYVGKKRSRVGRQAPRIGLLDIDKGVIEDGGNKKVVCIHVCVRWVPRIKRILITTSLNGK